MSHELVAQKLTAAGLLYTVKDETQKIAQITKADVVKTGHRFKVTKDSIDEPIGVTVIECNDPAQKSEVQAFCDSQAKLIEQMSPGKYTQAYLAASGAFVVMMNFRLADQAVADEIRAALES